MMKKVKETKGFTLAELLIVVAIIAVLVAVSIPIFTSKLEKSREATDIANQRAAKAAVVVAILDGEINGTAIDTSTTYYYDAAKGVVTTTSPTTGYGKGTGATGDADNKQDNYDPGKPYKNGIISIVFGTGANTATLTWSVGGTSFTVGQ